MARNISQKKVLPTNPFLAGAAVAAVTNPGYEARAGYCQRFVRQVVQKVYGSRFDRMHLATAEKSRQAWVKAGYGIAPERGSLVGDLLYKRGTKSQPAGHVGIRVAGNKVAENATTTRGRKQGFKGYRTLAEFGKVDTIVRLPRP